MSVLATGQNALAEEKFMDNGAVWTLTRAMWSGTAMAVNLVKSGLANGSPVSPGLLLAQRIARGDLQFRNPYSRRDGTRFRRRGG